MRNRPLAQSCVTHGRIKSRRRHAIKPNSLAEPRVFERQNGMRLKITQKGFRQHSAHEGNGSGVEPAPAPWKSVRMQNRSDVEGKIEILHQCDPGTKRHHISAY